MEQVYPMRTELKTFAAYLKVIDPKHRAHAKTMRALIRGIAPKAEELIRYGMPAYHLHGPLVYFAAMKGHLGFYPTSSGIRAFSAKLKSYSTSKGCVRFPYAQSLPAPLIRAMVRYRVRENLLRKKSQ